MRRQSWYDESPTPAPFAEMSRLLLARPDSRCRLSRGPLPGGGTGYYSGGAFNKIQAIKAYRALTFHKETPGLKESKDFVDANEVSIESYFREIKNGTP